MEHREYLPGGRENKIYRSGKMVVRPANIWTPNVHKFLRCLIEHGVDFVPVPYEIMDGGDEKIAFMEGEVYNYPLPVFFLTDDMIRWAAGLLLKFHKYSAAYIKSLTGQEHWMLEPIFPAEVICHGDFAPYNVTVVGEKPMNMIDFDTIHPGPRIWDIVYAVYRWVPFTNAAYREYGIDIKEQIRRTRLFLDNYGVDNKERQNFTHMLLRRLKSLIAYMRSQAEAGNKDFQANIDEGHMQVYLDDIRYIESNEVKITEGIM